MKTIYKYVVLHGPINSFEMGKEVELAVPTGSEILTVAMQGIDLVAWVAIADSGWNVSKLLRLWGTGNTINSDFGGQETLKYISTVVVTPGLVIHAFEHLY